MPYNYFHSGTIHSLFKVECGNFLVDIFICVLVQIFTGIQSLLGEFIVAFVMLFIFLAIIITGFTLGYKYYKRELQNKDWYEDFYYIMESRQCSHEKRIKLSETNWRIHFVLRRQLSKSAWPEIRSNQRTETSADFTAINVVKGVGLE